MDVQAKWNCELVQRLAKGEGKSGVGFWSVEEKNYAGGSRVDSS